MLELAGRPPHPVLGKEDALALSTLRHDDDPDPTLHSQELGDLAVCADGSWQVGARALAVLNDGIGELGSLGTAVALDEGNLRSSSFGMSVCSVATGLRPRTTVLLADRTNLSYPWSSLTKLNPVSS